MPHVASYQDSEWSLTRASLGKNRQKFVIFALKGPKGIDKALCL
jgi:hypothetical protein